MEKLKQYLALADMTPAAFARQIGASRGYLHDLLNGRRTPSLRIASAIERESGGLVPASCWLLENTRRAA